MSSLYDSSLTSTVPVKIDATNFGVSVTPSVVVRFLSSKRFSKALFFYFAVLIVSTPELDELGMFTHVM